jgi:hypothetical protein
MHSEKPYPRIRELAAMVIMHCKENKETVLGAVGLFLGCRSYCDLGQRLSHFLEVGTIFISQNTSADHLTLFPFQSLYSSYFR